MAATKSNDTREKKPDQSGQVFAEKFKWKG